MTIQLRRFRVYSFAFFLAASVVWHFAHAASQHEKFNWQPLAPPAPTDVLHATAWQNSPAQQTAELRHDDGTVEGGALQDGLMVLNRFTPPSYPATLQRVRVLFPGFQGQPDPTGKSITLLVYADPGGTGQLPANAPLLRQTLTVPGVSLSSFFEASINNGPTLTSGDFYLGYQAPSPHQGVGFAFDTNNANPPSPNRTFISTDNGASFSITPPQPGTVSAIAMMRAFVFMPNVQGAPTLAVAPATLDFGNVTINQTAERALTLTNNGLATLAVSSITSNNPRFTVNVPQPPYNITPTMQQQVGIRFSPDAVGAQSGTLTINSNDPTRAAFTIPVTGTGAMNTPAFVPLTSGVPQTGSLSATTSGACAFGLTQYTIAAPAGTSSLQITVAGSQDLDLYARFNTPVQVQNNQVTADFRAESLTNTETITISPATTPALQAGTYYVAISNCSVSNASFTLTATVTTGTSGQVTEELGTDDGSPESGLSGAGATFVNRLTPSRYPSRLQKIRIFFAQFSGQPDPSGQQIRLIAFNLVGGGTPLVSPPLLYDRSVTLPALTAGGRFVEFEVSEMPMITEGDWFVGFQSPNPANGVICTVDVSSNAQSRFYARTLTGAYTLISTANAMMRAVTLAGEQPACTYAITPASQNFAASGGTGSVSVSAPNGCNWTAASNASFLTITTGATGSGNGAVTFSAAANTAQQARSGTLTIAGQTFTVNQAAFACTYTLTPASQNFAAAGGNGTVAVAAANGCAWTAMSNAGFITVMSGAMGSGNGTVAYTVAANTLTTQRIGALTIAGQTFTVTQEAQSCSYTIAPTSQSVAAAGGAGSLNVTAASGCAWTATSNAAFVSITNGTSGATGSGNGTVAYSVAANPTPQQRTGTLTVAGQTFTVTQAALACSFTIAPTGESFGASGGNGSVNVTASNAACAWTAASNATWLTVLSGASGTGNGAVMYQVAANATTAARTGTLTVAGSIFTVTQQPPCTYAIAPTSQAFEASGGNGNVNVTAGNGCAWTATSNAAFVTITNGTTGSGNGAVAYTIAANTTQQARTGTLTIAGQTFTVTQAALVCGYTLTPVSRSVTAEAGAGSVNVAAPTGCNWTATSHAPFLTIATGASGNGNGTVGYAFTANPDQSQRMGALTVAGQTFTLTQAAAPPNPVASVSAASFRHEPLAPESIVAAFGVRLATRSEAASTTPLPTTLAGTSLRIRDSAGVERQAQLFFVAPTQVNFLLPAGLVSGAATLTVTSGDGTLAAGALTIAAVAPSLFAANANGQSVAAGSALRVRADNSQVFEPLALLDAAQNRFVVAPVDVSNANEQVFLVLFGTGFRNVTRLADVSVRIGGAEAEVFFAGAQGQLAGLDQLNVRLPRTLAGRGEVDIQLVIGERAANVVRVLVK